jgi:hypothetical protein
VKITVECEVPEAFVEVIVKKENLTREQAVKFIQQLLGEMLTRLWPIVLKAEVLRQAGVISEQECDAKLSEISDKICYETVQRLRKKAEP